MNGLDPRTRAFRYCPYCRERLVASEEGGRLRPRCSSCGFVQYLNPAPGAAVILRRGDTVCLVQRRCPPHEGQWTLPTGFMEWDETIAETARREMREETGLDVRLTGLFAVHTGVLPPDQPVVVVFFTAQEQGGELRPGDDAVQAGFFPLDALPGRIAFAVHRRVLRDLGAVCED